MSIEVRLIGGFGNNLFQYAFARMLAEQTGRALSSVEEPLSQTSLMWQVGVRSGLRLSSLAHAFLGSPLDIEGNRYTSPEYSLTDEDLGTSGECWEALKANHLSRPPGLIRVRGYFQRTIYFSPQRRTLQKWFEPAHVRPTLDIRSNDVLVSVRRGQDFRLHGWVLASQYYEKILNGMPNLGRIFVIGSNVDEETRCMLQPFHPIYLDGTALEHFRYMLCFKRLVLPNSTFAWWGAFLSEAEEIYGPETSDPDLFSFKGCRGVDLQLEESRYHSVLAEPDPHVIRFALHRDSLQRVLPLGVARVVAGSRLETSLYIGVQDEWERSFLEWFGEQRTPVTLRQIRAHIHDTRCTAYLSWLIKHRIVQVIDTWPCTLAKGRHENG